MDKNWDKNYEWKQYKISISVPVTDLSKIESLRKAIEESRLQLMYNNVDQIFNPNYSFPIKPKKSLSEKIRYWIYKKIRGWEFEEY